MKVVNYKISSHSMFDSKMGAFTDFLVHNLWKAYKGNIRVYLAWTTVGNAVYHNYPGNDFNRSELK